MFIVTGANGFIGSAIVWQLNKSHKPVLAAVDLISRDARPQLLQKRKFENYLLKDDIWAFLDRPENREKVTWIIHMGANSSTTEKNWEHLYENNTLYTQKLFEWCTKHKKNFLYASSAATYGAGEHGYSDTTDSDKLKPLNLYGESKVQFDRWAVKQTATPPKWYGLKFFNVFGPNEYHKGAMTSVVFKAFHQIKETGHLKLFKSYKPEYKHGEQKRDFVYVKDVSRWILEMCEPKSASAPSGIYNMGFGKARTWVDLGRASFAALNAKENIEFIEMPDDVKNQYQYFTLADMSKFQKAGFSAAQWPLETAITDYIKNYLLKPDAFL